MNYKIYELAEALQNPEQVQGLRIESASNWSAISKFRNLEWLSCQADSHTTRWEFIVQLPKLKTLILQLSDTFLAEAFFDLPRIESLTVSVSGNFSMPVDGFHRLTSLRYFSFIDSSNRPIAGKDFPLSVFRLCQLESLQVSIDAMKDWPKDAFLHLQGLTHLTVYYQKASETILNAIFSCQPLQTLSLVRIKYAKGTIGISQLPDSIGNLQNVKNLSLQGFKLNQLPESFSQLTQLESLNLSANLFTDLPFKAQNFRHLKTLIVNSNKIELLPKSLLELENLQTLDWYSNPITKHSLHKKGKLVVFFLKKLKGLPATVRQTAWALFADEATLSNQLTNTQLVETAIVNSQFIQDKVQQLLSQRVANPLIETGPSQEKTIGLAGKKFFGLTRDEITERIQTQGIAVKDIPDSGITHVVLGESPSKNSISAILKTSLPIATAEHLKQWLEVLENPYLKQADESQTENLMRLLTSYEEENVTLALQMMETGGIPPTVVYEVFCLCFYKTWSDQYYNPAPALRQTFEKIGPHEMVQLTKMHWKKENEKLAESLLQQDFLDKRLLFDAVFTFFEPSIDLFMDGLNSTPVHVRYGWWQRLFKSLVIRMSAQDTAVVDYVLEVLKNNKIIERLAQQDSQAVLWWLQAQGKIQDYIASLWIENKTLDLRDSSLNLMALPPFMPIETLIVYEHTISSMNKSTIEWIVRIKQLKRIFVKKNDMNWNISHQLKLWQKHAPQIEIILEKKVNKGANTAILLVK